MPDVLLPAARAPLPVYLALPDGEGPWPAVVVVHDATGMSRDLRHQCDWLAGEGFLAAAPDLFRGRTVVGCLPRVLHDLTTGRGRTFEDVERVRAWLGERTDCTGRFGVAGFCMGGGYALALAPGGRFDACSSSYGGCPDDPLVALRGACPVVGSYGGADRTPLGAGAAERLEQALTELGVDHDVRIYPGAGHGFMNDHDPADVRGLLALATRWSGTVFDPVATADARQRIVRFFREHLGGVPVR